MLSAEQKAFFEREGYLVVENVFDQKSVIDPVKAEYSILLDRLYGNWFAEGKVTVPPETLDFHGKLLTAYKAGCDWFQPLDISLPGDQIKPDTPMHFGPAIFDLVTHTALLDLIEDLDGVAARVTERSLAMGNAANAGFVAARAWLDRTNVGR